MSNPVELFRDSAKVKDIHALFADIANGLEKNEALHRCTVIGHQIGGDERHALVSAVYAELKKHV
jgi:hypothetical protein